jgi:hypothetical protein
MARALNITQETAWFVDHRLRFSLGMGARNKRSGRVEADDAFIGGQARNKRKDKREPVITGTGGMDQTAVSGILERGGKTIGGKVRTKVIGNTKTSTPQQRFVTMY